MRIAVWQQVDASHLGSMAMLQSDRYRADFCWALGRAHLAADERFPDAKLRAQHGKTQMVGIPVRLSETPGSVRAAAPGFGRGHPARQVGTSRGRINPQRPVSAGGEA